MSSMLCRTSQQAGAYCHVCCPSQTSSVLGHSAAAQWTRSVETGIQKQPKAALSHYIIALI